MMRSIFSFWLALQLLAASAPALGASHPCARHSESIERLACYDREFPPVEGVAPPPNPFTEAQLQQQFGLTERELEMRKSETERAAQIERIEAIVRQVLPLRGGQREVVLDNDQVWRLTEGGSRGPLSAGDTVSIRRTFAGGYLLSKPGGTGLRVRRVR